MTPEKMSLPRFWRGQKERYSLVGKKFDLPNPGEVIIFQGKPFNLKPDGSLVPFSEEEKRKFILK